MVGWPAGSVRKYNDFVAQLASWDLQQLKLSLNSKLGPIVATYTGRGDTTLTFLMGGTIGVGILHNIEDQIKEK